MDKRLKVIKNIAMPQNSAELEKQDIAEIVFLCPYVDYNKPWDFSFTDHLGASFVRAYLKARGIHVSQFIHRESIDPDTLIREILRQKVKIVGFTCYDTTYPIVKTLSSRLKEAKQDLIILVGGITATFSDHFILENVPAVDICVRREGEYTAYELIKRLREDGDISGIEGISYRANGNIVRNPDRPLIASGEKGAELDILPSPVLNDIIIPEDNFGIITSRGCIYKCSYCNFASMSNWTIRYHSVDRIISELKKLNGVIQHVPILDDTFTLNVVRAKDICRRIIEEKINLSFWCQTRGDRVDRELFELMYQAGFKHLNFGLESAVPRVLSIAKKVRAAPLASEDTLEPEKEFVRRIKESVVLAKEIGLDPAVNIIIGLPGANLEDDQETIRFVDGLQVNSYVHSVLNIYPGTELFLTHDQYNIGIKPSATGLPYNTYPAYDQSPITELENSQRLLFRKQEASIILKVLTGEYGDIRDIGYPNILFRSCFPMSDNYVDCLNSFVSMGSRIGFLCNKINDGNLRTNLQKIVSRNSTILHCYSFELIQSLKGMFGEYRVMFNAADYAYALGSFKLEPFQELFYSRNGTFEASSAEKSKKVLVLDNAYYAKEFYKSMNMEGLNKDNLFLDACRWANCDCPAICFRRAFVGEDGLISPCFHGESVGSIHDSRQQIAMKIKVLWDDIRSQRGCDSCEARNSCSKCMFPNPLTHEEFCRIKKELVS